MSLLQRHAGEWLPALFLSLIGVCSLVTLILCSPASRSDELEELSVIEVDGEYIIKIVSVLNAPADYVYNVITDYKHAYRINPTITEVEILSSNYDEVIRVRNHSEQWVGPFCFNIKWVGDVYTNNEGDITVITIPELSSFESGSAIWKIYPQGEQTWVLYESRLKPDFFIPPLMGDTIMKNKMRADTLATFKRIECHATIMFERDMENDTELISDLLEEGKDCISSENLAGLMHP